MAHISLGDLIDAAYEAREAVKARKKELEQDKKLAALTARRDELEAQIFQRFEAERTSLAKGSIAKAYFTTDRIPRIDLENGGWPKLFAWIKKNDAFDMFEKRLAKLATLDRLDRGDKIPAIQIQQERKLQLRGVAEKDE